MGISRQLGAIEQGFQIVESFPEYRRTPIILGESDPEGCAACSARSNPQNSYRNGPLYAAYTAETLNSIFFLANREHINFLGAVTWAFEFEDQPYFEGFRTLATNGVDKPVLNAFRMFSLLGNDRVKATGSGGLAPEAVVRDGVRGKPDISVIASRNEKRNEIEVLIWNYHDDDLPAVATPIDLVIGGLPAKTTRGLVEHFRVDASHSNAFTAWKDMGSPQSPTPAQYEVLQSAGQLQLLTSPAWTPIAQGAVHLQFALPRQALSLVRISWQ
jgi:xylan 1,4-beta-xylosidase